MKSNQIQKRVIKKIIEIELTEEEAKDLLVELNHICGRLFDEYTGEAPQIIDDLIELLVRETNDD